ncbi:MAG: hypothetical protein IKT07_11950 [Oscillospiraceae bacterium]|nr:hypothetical protein [Oscillospiraceae bacterium]
METTTMQTLLAADEEKVTNTLRANITVDRSRERCVETLRGELGDMILRYNADCSDDVLRQAVADSMASAVRDSMEFLLAGAMETKKGEKKARAGAPLLLILAIAVCAAGIFLLREQMVKEYVVYACLAAAVLLAFIAGRIWFKDRDVSARLSLDPDAVWYTMKRTAETMDRKLREFSERAKALEEKNAEAEGETPPLTQEELALFGDMLESLYADSGEYALRQIKKVVPYLKERGIELVDYDRNCRELFELFPTKNAAATMRPAILWNNKLLLIGRATEPAL